MRIYFSGIGGVGLGPLAEIARDASYDIVGSDPHESLMTHELVGRGVEISSDQSGGFLRAQHESTPIDWFVYTSALPANHPELQLAQTLGIRTAKRDELLAHIIDEKNLKLIAIAGTHGKTTTTGMMVWALQQLGIPVSYSIGTTLSWGPSGKFDPESKYFVYECDEFDRNFLHFRPYLSLITSIEWDHPDTYPAESDYMAAFRQFIDQSQQTIVWQHDERRAEAVDLAHRAIDESLVRPFHLAGEHNRRNATLVFEALEMLNVGNGDSIKQTAVESFPGTNRRFEKLADNLYTDYGHHPSEIRATLQMAHELSDHVVLVYQPHQNVRQHEIRDQYTDDIFADADEVYWLPTYLSRENPDLEILSPEELTEHLGASKIHVTNLDDDLWHIIQNARESGALVLAMGAGTIDGWVRTKL